MFHLFNYANTVVNMLKPNFNFRGHTHAHEEDLDKAVETDLHIARKWMKKSN